MRRFLRCYFDDGLRRAFGAAAAAGAGGVSDFAFGAAAAALPFAGGASVAALLTACLNWSCSMFHHAAAFTSGAVRLAALAWSSPVGCGADDVRWAGFASGAASAGLSAVFLCAAPLP